MKTSPADSPEPPAELRDRRGKVAGYLSLALADVLFAIPHLPQALAPFKVGMGLAVLVSAVVLGIRGISRGRGGGKLAAWLSLAVLSFTMVASVVIEGYRTLAETDRP